MERKLSYLLTWVICTCSECWIKQCKEITHSTRGAVCMLFHWEVKQRRLHTLTMSNEGQGGVASTSFCCWQLGDLFFPSYIPSTGRKKDGQHYVVAYENKHLHGFCATWWVCSMRGRQAYRLVNFLIASLPHWLSCCQIGASLLLLL